MRINKDDIVVIRVGEFKYVSGTDNVRRKARVLSVDRESQKIIVEGVHVVKKHVKRSKLNPQGGILRKEMPIAISNVQVVCPKCHKPTRVGAGYDTDGSKHRVCKKCKSFIGRLSPATKSTVTKS